MTLHERWSMRFAVSDFADSFNSVRVSSTLAAATSGFGAAPLFPKKRKESLRI